ncbi:DUF421 domain-containing protein [Trueperella pecoris]|uniref:DUF421 domain-containing protein n=1 Tax=Trueperella pecoris TaxID=2733571 RepID=A0A7M1QY02_9ACTO|nr:YetF domain-containing protein [Trueperella pecoris]QOR46972.1 DUF421 domain-containing protein [Trueperella pecoris]
MVIMKEINALTFGELLGITGFQALAIVVGTIAMYTFLLVLLRVLGQRVSARLSTYDMAAIIIIGAIAGRATLGHTPTLAGGVVALLTLFSVRAVLGFLRLNPLGNSIINNPPIVVMAGTTIFTEALREAHVSQDELWMALRQAGVRNDDEVAAVVLEPNGSFSVLRRGVPIDPRILAHTRGQDLIPPAFLGDKRFGDLA